MTLTRGRPGQDLALRIQFLRNVTAKPLSEWSITSAVHLTLYHCACSCSLVYERWGKKNKQVTSWRSFLSFDLEKVTETKVKVRCVVSLVSHFKIWFSAHWCDLSTRRWHPRWRMLTFTPFTTSNSAFIPVIYTPKRDSKNTIRSWICFRSCSSSFHS